MASDHPEHNDAEQDQENTQQNDLQEIADLKIQERTFPIDSDLVSISASHPAPLVIYKQLQQINTPRLP